MDMCEKKNKFVTLRYIVLFFVTLPTIVTTTKAAETLTINVTGRITNKPCMTFGSQIKSFDFNFTPAEWKYLAARNLSIGEFYLSGNCNQSFARNAYVTFKGNSNDEGHLIMGTGKEGNAVRIFVNDVNKQQIILNETKHYPSLWNSNKQDYTFTNFGTFVIVPYFDKSNENPQGGPLTGVLTYTLNWE